MNKLQTKIITGVLKMARKNGGVNMMELCKYVKAESIKEKSEVMRSVNDLIADGYLRRTIPVIGSPVIYALPKARDAVDL